MMSALQPATHSVAEAVALIDALDHVLHAMPPEARNAYKGDLELQGAPLITATSLRALAQALRKHRLPLPERRSA